MPVAPDRAHELRLGRSAPSPTPKIAVRDFVDIERALALPAEQRQISMSWRVKAWPMLLNDQLGDCTCAAAAHHKQLACVYALAPFTVTDQDVERMYQASGYNPAQAQPDGSNPTDQGWTLADAAGYARTTGLQGTPDITAYAHVDTRDEDAQQIAHWLFGGLYTGAALPRSAADQYRAGQPWDITNNGNDAGSWGGHAMLRINSILHRRASLVTWNGVQVATDAWLHAYVDEYMALVPVEWETHMPAYMKLAQLVDFQRLSQLLGQVTTAT